MSRQRPAHIHFKISAPGYNGVTTQLYFEGDPNLSSDPLRAVRPALIRPLIRVTQPEELRAHGLDRSGLACTFDITLRQA